MSTYMEKLKDPRWQKMRLKVLERDDWACLSCSATGDTLHVHHTYYENGIDPWDYPFGSLVTLCGYCHEEESGAKRSEKENKLLHVMRIYGYLSNDIHLITRAIETRNLEILSILLKERFDVKD